MIVKPFTQRLELTFWTTIIPLMSESPIVQRTMYHFYKLVNELEEIVNTRPLLSLALAGLVFGFLFGFMSGLI
jgi:hypothetical protein